MNLGSTKGTVLQSLLLYREARLPGRTFAAGYNKRDDAGVGEMGNLEQ